MKVKLFIITDSVHEIATFDDERIQITSSIQNVNDISKVFTDYTQSFNVPAIENNKVFKHWYESAVKNGYDHRINYDGYIEIDTATFRVGKWRLEGAKVENGKATSYKITFFGSIKSLTDKFRDDKLKDVQQLDAYSFEYSPENVKARIQTTDDLDVLFPLISSKRPWQYGGGGLNDISNSSTPLLYTELIPALKLSSIFNAIELKYSINFIGAFLAQPRFTQAFLWMKNPEESLPLSAVVNADLKTISVGNPLVVLNAPEDKWTFVYIDSNSFKDFKHDLNVTFSGVVAYKVTVYKNGTSHLVLTGEGNSTGVVDLPNDETAEYFITVQTGTAINYTVLIYASHKHLLALKECTINGNGSIAFNLSLLSYSPDIKVSDFFAGVLKMFNLTAISENGIDFKIEQLEEWYQKGTIKDFTKYAEPNWEVDKVKVYNKIRFQYQESKSVLNFGYEEVNGMKHGDLVYELGNEGEDYEVKLPFENLLFQKFTGTSLATAYAIDKDLKPYLPKPVIIYKYGNVPTSFKFKGKTTTSDVTQYNVFGQDLAYGDEIHSLNFGAEVSPYLSAVVNNGLFRDYYLQYLRNLYEMKSRMIKIRMRLSYLDLINLKLNDRIVVNEKRYIINKYVTDLETFESDFELIEDLRLVEIEEEVPVDPDLEFPHNLFIGGVAATINTPALLISKIQSFGASAFNPNNIKNFEVRGNDIRCSIIEDFIVPQDSFGYNSGCTYFIDKGSRAKTVGFHPWRNGATAQAQALIKKAELNGVTSIDRDFTNSTTNNTRSIRLKSLTSINPIRTFTAMSNCKLYIPSLQTIGLPSVDNEVFAGSTNSTIYVHPFLATCNGGNPDADLVSAIAAGNTVVYVDNQTPPAKITTLSVGSKTATSIQLIFSTPTSLNTIESYEVFIDEIPYQIISGSGQSITGLSPATTYSKIEVRAIDQYYNRAEQMDLNKMIEVKTYPV